MNCILAPFVEQEAQDLAADYLCTYLDAFTIPKVITLATGALSASRLVFEVLKTSPQFDSVALPTAFKGQSDALDALFQAAYQPPLCSITNFINGSISLSPLYPSPKSDLHVSTSTSLHQSFLWLRPAQA